MDSEGLFFEIISYYLLAWNIFASKYYRLGYVEVNSEIEFSLYDVY